MDHPYSDRFLRFANEAEEHEGPLYARIARFIASRPQLLDMAAHARQEPVPNVILAAVHALLLERPDEPLARYYPSVGGAETDPGLEPAFEELCLRESAALVQVIRTRLCQTNEVRRAACLLPAFVSSAGGRDCAFIEVGTSAGLLLAWDHYRYAYGDGTRCGDDDSGLLIECDVRGKTPPVSPFPSVRERIGVDLNPLGPACVDDARWLRALVWPEHHERAERLEKALAIAREVPIRRVSGDATDVLVEVFEGLDPDLEVVLFHSSTINQFTPELAHDFETTLGQCAAVHPFSSVAANGLTITVSRHGSGRVSSETVASYDSHGRWLDWR